MFRKDLVEWLRQPLSLKELSRLVGLPLRRVEGDLRHFIRSARHSSGGVIVTPARCRTCGFRFRPDKLHKPGRCPVCGGIVVSEPRFQFEDVQHGEP